MAKRALVVHPSYKPLAGFANSAACMAQVLQARGFEVVRCEGADATRASILRAYDALIAGARDLDAVVIFYVGHGGLTVNTAYNAEHSDLPRCIQNICPSDFADTTEDDFHGISSYELSLRLTALTEKTKNVTVILDCCYATDMVRGGESPDPVRRVPELTRVGLTKHLQAVRAQSANFAALDRIGNPHAVRIFATGQTGGAFQMRLPGADALRALALELPSGGWIESLTFQLAQVLASVGDARVPWRSIVSELRARMVVQRPEIAGPDLRVPFTLATVEPGTFAVRSEAGTAIIDAGLILGVALGDVYGVMPAGAKAIEPARLLDRIIVTEVSATGARAPRPAWRSGDGELPTNAVAIPISRAQPALAVRIVADDATRAAVATALQVSTRLRAATAADTEVIAELRVRGDALEVRDALGPLFPPAPYPAQLAAAVSDLENIATAHRLRVMADDYGTPPAGVTVQLMLIRGADRRALADHGEALGLGDRVALRLMNAGASTVHVHPFNIGLRRRVGRLSRAPSGIALDPGETRYVSNEMDGAPEGLRLYWPAGLPRDQPRLDTMMVIITPEPADLSALVSREHLAVTRSGLEPAEGKAADGPPDFALRWLDYRLFPIDASLDFGAPQFDANPPGSPPPCGVAPTLRIRLAGLASAVGTRLDVLVCARSEATPYRATTVSGEAPSELEIWRGDLRGPADVYVWTSPVTADRRTLTELLAQARVAEPAAMLRAPDGDPRAALAAGASMQLAAMARAALRAIAPDVATAFRGSFGPNDGAATRYAAPGVSFAIVIDRP